METKANMSFLIWTLIVLSPWLTFFVSTVLFDKYGINLDKLSGL